MLAGKLYDGVTAAAHDVEVDIDGDDLRLVHKPKKRVEVIAGATLRRVDGAASDIRLSRTDVPGWRLNLPLEAGEQLAAILGREERYGRWIDRIGLLPATAIGALVTALVLGIGYLAPRWVAPKVPMSWERNVGSAIVGDFGDLKCRSKAGQKALEALVESVAPGAISGPDAIKIAALDVGVFNAAALPGGYIVVFRPAITESEPEALAGILAHEIAHVRRRHVTEALIRELGIGALIRLFAGNVGANAEQIVALNYTRANEAEADGDAIAMLKRAGISPLPTAKLFKKLADDDNKLSGFSAEFLQSHPLSESRAKRFEQAFDPKAHYRAPLTRDQQDALFETCSGRGPVK